MDTREDKSETFTFGSVADRFPHYSESTPDGMVSVDMNAIGEDFVLLAKMQGMSVGDFLGSLLGIWVMTDEVEKKGAPN